MARRQRIRPSQPIRSEILGRIRAGEDTDTVLADIRARYPNVNVTQLRAIISGERDTQALLSTINSRNRGQYTNVSALFGCAPGQYVRARVTVYYTDPETGLSRSFGFGVDIRGSGRWKDFLNSALEEVRREAARRGSPVPSRQVLEQDPGFSIRIEGFQCL